MPSLRAAFPLMLNDLTGVPGLCGKVFAKGLFSLVQCVSQFASSDSRGVVIVMAEHLKHLWMICCVFVSEKPKRIDCLSHFFNAK